jgi:hypothetical protein
MALSTRIVGCDTCSSGIIAFVIAALSAVRALPRDAVRLGPGRHLVRTVEIGIIGAQETNAMRSCTSTVHSWRHAGTEGTIIGILSGTVHFPERHFELESFLFSS